MTSPWTLSPSDAADLEARVSREIRQAVKELSPLYDGDALLILQALLNRGYQVEELIAYWDRRQAWINGGSHGE